MLKETPYWWDTAPALPNLRVRPLPAKTEVVVIGGGYTGLSAARVLAMRGVQVTVLEKEALGWGASSRNGGQVLTGLKLGPGALIKQLGRERAQEMYAASLAAVAYLENILEEEGIQCEYAHCGHLEAACKPKHFEQYRRDQDLLAREFNHEVQLIERAEQARELGASRYHGLMLDETSTALHPAKYVRGLAMATAALGAQLCEHLPATQIVRAGTGYAVVTPQGTIQAEKVLIATNGYTDNAAGEIRRRVFPLGSYMIATEPLPEALAAQLIPQRRVVFDSKHFLYYFRLSADNRLLFGGRADYQPPTPEATRKSAEILRRGLADVFPALKGTPIEYVWGGNLCVTADFLPRAGQHEGIYFALGYAGHGVALATYLGGQMANSMCGAPGKNPFKDLPFDPLPFYYGPSFRPFGARWYKLLDVLN